MANYKISFEFLNPEGEWIADEITNNAEGFSFSEACDKAIQLVEDGPETKRNIRVEKLSGKEIRVRPSEYAYGELCRW